MVDKLNVIKQRFNEVTDLIIQPDIISDQKKYIKINKEYKDLKNIMEKGNIYFSQSFGPRLLKSLRFFQLPLSCHSVATQ